MIEDLSQPWSPPKELLAPTPRPVKGKQAAINRNVRIAGASFFSLAGAALLGWILFGLWRQPGGTLGAKWEGFEVTGQADVWLFLFVLIYIFILPGSLLGYFKMVRDQRCLKWGNPARAIVTGVQSRVIRKRYSAYMKYEFALEYQDDAGTLVKSKVASSTQRFSQNEVVTVLYDPHKPSELRLPPAPGYEIGGTEGP